ncbi:hypothetical protein F5Y11DRAFT_309143 [Daldinia sp. FL1419]|nr:hypothetical protein F5Y11DRAFT_309143 [Daldinia sp. FL1419]
MQSVKGQNGRSAYKPLAECLFFFVFLRTFNLLSYRRLFIESENHKVAVNMGNPKEAGEEGISPPPYTAVDTDAPPASHNGEAPSYEAISGESSSGEGVISGIKNRFPQSLNAYFERMFMSKGFYLGEHAGVPLYMVTGLQSGWLSKLTLEMRAGPKDTDPIIATAAHEKRWSSGKRTIIQIFPDPATDSVDSAGPSTSAGGSGSSSGTPVAAKTITMTQQHERTRLWYDIPIEVGIGKELREENFQWRRTRGKEAKELDNWGEGWKLVRLEGTEAGHGTTSDDKEVVAVWTLYGGFSMTKFCRFRFLGAGATGVLGDTFAIAALISGLKIWYLEWLQLTATNAAVATS